jgi:hypothetical protein
VHPEHREMISESRRTALKIRPVLTVSRQWLISDQLTPEGIKRENDIDRDNQAESSSVKKLD